MTFTSLFPNEQERNLGVFVYQRMAAFAARNGNSVEVIAPLPYFPSWIRGGKWDKYGKIGDVENVGMMKVHHPRYPLLPRISMPLHAWLMYAGSVALAKKLHRENPFTCVDAHFVYPDGKAGVLLGRALGVPTIVSGRGSDVNLYPGFRLIRPQICWTLREAAGRIAVSKAIQKSMLDMAGESADVCVIGNGIDPERFHAIDRMEARKELQIPQEGRVVVAVGALVSVKGQDVLIRAFNQLRSRFPDLRLYLVGEGRERPKLEKLIRSLGAEDVVHLAGSCPNERLSYWYGAADVSCLASSREGWPNVLLESLACGTPVVATRVWGTPEVISSAELGVLVDQTTDSIAAGLEAALSRKWDRDQLVAHARGRSWKVVGQEVEEYFKSVTEGAATSKGQPWSKFEAQADGA